MLVRELEKLATVRVSIVLKKEWGTLLQRSLHRPAPNVPKTFTSSPFFASDYWPVPPSLAQYRLSSQTCWQRATLQQTTHNFSIGRNASLIRTIQYNFFACTVPLWRCRWRQLVCDSKWITNDFIASGDISYRTRIFEGTSKNTVLPVRVPTWLIYTCNKGTT